MLRRICTLKIPIGDFQRDSPGGTNRLATTPESHNRPAPLDGGIRAEIRIATCQQPAKEPRPATQPMRGSILADRTEQATSCTRLCRDGTLCAPDPNRCSILRGHLAQDAACIPGPRTGNVVRLPLLPPNPSRILLIQRVGSGRFLQNGQGPNTGPVRCATHAIVLTKPFRRIATFLLQSCRRAGIVGFALNA